MFFRDYSLVAFDESASAWKALMLIGALLVLLAIIVLFHPEVLVAMVATVLLIVGSACIATSWRIRRQYRGRADVLFEDRMGW